MPVTWQPRARFATGTSGSIPITPRWFRLQQTLRLLKKEKAAAYLRDTVQRLAHESDLARQGEILEAALRAYPDESYFQEEARLVREKQVLVSGIVERARNHEGAGEYRNAVEEWKRLETVYPAYAGLQAEIDQAEASWQRQRAEKRAKYIADTEAAIATADYASAANLVDDALGEFPGDTRLLQLQEEASSKRERLEQFLAAVERVHDFAEGSKFGEAVDALKTAEALADGVSGSAKRIFETVMEFAERAIDADWRAAEAMLQQAARIYEERAVPSGLWERVRSAAREEDIRRYLTDSSGAESAGDFPTARRILQDGVSTYPNEPRLRTQLKRVLAILEETRKREERERDLKELVALKAEVEGLDSPAQLSACVERCDALAGPYPKDNEFSTLAAEIKAQVAAFEKASFVLSEDRIQECLEICDQFLDRHPKHALFLGLKSQAEARERTLAAEYLEQVEQRLAATQDLEQRESILDEALKKIRKKLIFERSWISSVMNGISSKPLSGRRKHTSGRGCCGRLLKNGQAFEAYIRSTEVWKKK